MNAINCTLVPVNELDDAILTKIRLFGIFSPDEDKVVYGRGDHYCISHVKSYFDEDSLVALDSEESISDATKKNIKTQYMKICSFAFLFGIGKHCVRDKYNRLIPIDLSAQNQRNILENNNGMYSLSLVSEITDDIYERFNKLEEYDIITLTQKWDLINKYQEQLDHDDLILEEPDVGTCCCCGGPCNPCSQTCGMCPRNGRLMAWGLGYINEDGNPTEPIQSFNEVIDTVNEASNSDADDTRSDITDAVSECPNEPDSTMVDIYDYNGEQVCLLKDVIKCYKSQFKGCLDPKKAVVKKNIHPHYIVSRHKKHWVPCADIKERRARILVSVSWVRSNILGFFQ